MSTITVNLKGIDDERLEEITNIIEEELCLVGEEFTVMTEDERQTAVEEYIRDSIEYFNQSFLINYLDDEKVRNFFEGIYTEWNKSYAEDIKSEYYGGRNRLESEMEERGAETEEEFVEMMTEEQLDEGNNGYDHYVSNFGEEEAKRLIFKDNLYLIDIDAVIEGAIDADGHAHFLNTYDGKEHEIEVDGETYYVYRDN